MKYHTDLTAKLPHNLYEYLLLLVCISLKWGRIYLGRISNIEINSFFNKLLKIEKKFHWYLMKNTLYTQ